MTNKEKIADLAKDSHFIATYYGPNTIDENKKKICWYNELILGFKIGFNGSEFGWGYEMNADVSGVVISPTGKVESFANGEQLLKILRDGGITKDDEVILTDDYIKDVTPYVSKDAAGNDIVVKNPPKTIICYEEGPFVTLSIHDPEAGYRHRLKQEFFIDTKDDDVVNSILSNIEVIKILQTLQNLKRRAK